MSKRRRVPVAAGVQPSGRSRPSATTRTTTTASTTPSPTRIVRRLNASICRIAFGAVNGGGVARGAGMPKADGDPLAGIGLGRPLPMTSRDGRAGRGGRIDRIVLSRLGSRYPWGVMQPRHSPRLTRLPRSARDRPGHVNLQGEVREAFPLRRTLWPISRDRRWFAARRAGRAAFRCRSPGRRVLGGSARRRCARPVRCRSSRP